jgi:hypothetical protein
LLNVLGQIAICTGREEKNFRKQPGFQVVVVVVVVVVVAAAAAVAVAVVVVVFTLYCVESSIVP